MGSFRFQITHDLIGIVVLLLVTSLVLVVHHTSILLTDFGPLSLSTSRLFNAGITVTATLFASLVSARIRHGLMRSLEARLRRMGTATDAEDRYDPGRELELKRLDRQWRGVLGIDTIPEKLGNISTFIIFLLCGLTTAAVVTALAPSLTNKAVPYHPVVPGTDLGDISNASTRSCFGILPSDVSIRSSFSWKFPNQSAFFSTVDGGCPPALTLTLSNGINKDDPDDYAYSVSGVGIERTAIAAPATIYKSQELATLSRNYGFSLMSTTQCVPVLVSNPVRCEKGGVVEMIGEHFLSARVGTAVRGLPIQDTTFNVTGRFPIRDLSRDSVMISHLFTANVVDGKLRSTDNDTNPTGTIGPGIFLFAARNDPLGNTPFAYRLAGAMNDPNITAGKGGNETYAVTCVIDARNSFDYRTVSLDLHALDRQKGPSTLARYISGGERCTPVTPTISNKLFAVAFTAQHYFAEENSGSSGYFGTIASLAGSYRGPPYAFRDSHNALEDVLGLIAALGVSQIPVVGSGASTDSEGASAEAIVQATRLGTDKQEVLVLLVPLLSSLVILVSLFVLSFREDWKPGGEEFRDKLRSERPERYAAESICQLAGMETRTEALPEAIVGSPKAEPAVIAVEVSQEPRKAQMHVVPLG